MNAIRAGSSMVKKASSSPLHQRYPCICPSTELGPNALTSRVAFDAGSLILTPPHRRGVEPLRHRPARTPAQLHQSRIRAAPIRLLPQSRRGCQLADVVTHPARWRAKDTHRSFARVLDLTEEAHRRQVWAQLGKRVRDRGCKRGIFVRGRRSGECLSLANAALMLRTYRAR